MMEAALQSLGNNAVDPLCIVPEHTDAPAGARAVEGNHPRTSGSSFKAGLAVASWAQRGHQHPTWVFLSGGASALAALPAPGIRYEDMSFALDVLLESGIPIDALNTIRKHLSQIKGGRLAKMIAPAPISVFVLSDVPGDTIEVIGSGPFAPDTTTFADALRALHASGAYRAMPESVSAHLARGARGELPETPKPFDPCFAEVSHYLLAGPQDLASTAASKARAAGFEVDLYPEPMRGDVSEVANRLAAWVREQASAQRVEKRMFVAAGEATIRVQSGSAGGRAQHLALLMANSIAGLPAAVLAAGSDGRDGPTELAGAVVNDASASAAAELGWNLGEELRRTQSGPVVNALGAGIPRFDTRTHLGDLYLAAWGGT
jgi:hydroxypyruvate reductase